MSIQDAISKAIVGGWTVDGGRMSYEPYLSHSPLKTTVTTKEGTNLRRGVSVHEMLLDPAFWVALGKTEGWAEPAQDDKNHRFPEWKWNMHRLIGRLADGGTIESYFATL